MNFSKGIPKEYATMIVIPSVVKNGTDIRNVLKKLEVYYLANKSENIYCTALGDPTAGSKEKEDIDQEIINMGLDEVERLNNKYCKEGKSPIFNFIYRKRIWSNSEKYYMGWERKRGLLTELNNFLQDRKSKNTFLVNTLGNRELKIKYIITLDSDTELPLNSGIELIEAMAHPLNEPVIKDGKVIDGYGIMQPRVGINLLDSMKSTFSEIFAGRGGVDSYTNAISDTYQDNFGEGIYTGKGIYDLKVFNVVMRDKIEDNTVLSHDLLEGCYLRCALTSDILLLDGYPKSYLSFLNRLHRWIRGDYQIIKWTRKTFNLNKLSRFKILDNIRRSLLEISVTLNIIILCILKMFTNVNILAPILIIFLSVVISSILELFNYIIFRKENVKKQRQFTKIIGGLSGSFYRGIINFITLPTKGYISLDAMCRTIYRMAFTKEHMLEWTTSEEAERKDCNKLEIVYKKMFPNVAIGILFLFVVVFASCSIYFKAFIYLLAGIFLLAPLVMWSISKEKVKDKKIGKLTEEEKIYIKNVAEKTWGYFAEYMNKDNSFLPPDNIQESRREKVVERTSSTNIGLGLLTIVSAYDLKFITLEKAIIYLENTISTIQKLEKWNGHLYNWYNTKTLKPLMPRYVSTVDSGNFVRIYVHIKSFFRGKERYYLWR